MPGGLTRRPAAWAGMLALIAALGAGLRLWMARDQVLLNDEWHGMLLALTRSLKQVYLHFGNEGANSSLTNLYAWLLLHSFGWSEIGLRLPFLAAGIASVVVFPWLVRDLIGRRAALLFGFLVAVSPFLVFYSRVCRPYAIVSLGSFVALVSLYRWARGESAAFGVAYVLAGTLAVYAHPTAAIAVLVPLAVLLAVRLLPTRLGAGVVRTPGSIAELGLRSGILLAILMLPAMILSPRRRFVQADQVGSETQIEALRMLSGSSFAAVSLLFCALLAAGLVALFRRHRLLGLLFLFVPLTYAAVLTNARWDGINEPVVVLRFAIGAMPVALAMVACGLDQLAEAAERLAGRRDARAGGLLAAGVGALLVLGTPLPRICRPPNSFTNHCAYQQDYRPISWDRSYVSRTFFPGSTLRRDAMPGFYRQAAETPSIRSLIEYPMFLGDHFNLHYYPQHFHRKRVRSGYVLFEAFRAPFSDRVYGNLTVDQVLSHRLDPAAFRFRNLVHIGSTADLEASGADALVLHKNLFMEVAPRLATEQGMVEDDPFIAHLAKQFRNLFGEPVFEDAQIVVFRLRRDS